MVAVFVTVTGLWTGLAAAPRNGLPLWPAYVFCALTLAALYFVFAPLRRCWPFRGPRSAVEMLDESIISGHELRRRITLAGSDHVEVGQWVWSWTLETATALQRWFPSVLDEFFAAHGSQQQFHGSRLALATLNARVIVLQNARRAA